ncbi:MAG: hypothetical protein HQL73_10005, partial [Magnetococcales bacterium]|nr:hypothetical protein [Magnetococcales bacterium]
MNTSIPDRWDDEMEPREVNWNPETRTYQYWTSYGGGWVDAQEKDMKTYDLNLEWLLAHIRDLMGIGKSMKVREIIPNLLWELGTIWIGRKKATVFCKRRTNAVLKVSCFSPN